MGQRLLAKERERKALELRKAGMSLRQIAEAVGYADESGAQRAIVRGLKNITHEPAQELKTLEMERLNAMLLVLWPKIQDPNHEHHFEAFDRALRLMDKIDRLQGLDAPQQVELSGQIAHGVLMIDGTKETYIEALKAMAGEGDIPIGALTTGEPVPVDQEDDGIEDAELVDEEEDPQAAGEGTGPTLEGMDGRDLGNGPGSGGEQDEEVPYFPDPDDTA